MTTAFVHSVQSEWLKQRRSLASWMVLIGAFFTPAIIITARLLNPAGLAGMYARDDFWQTLWRSSWESAAIFFLPMGTVLATSLVAQLEFKNNTWKQVRALPLSDATIYGSKLAIILAMLALFFVLFNVGIYLSALLPSILVANVPYPTAPIPWQSFLREDVLYFVDCLPIVALQYLVSLQFRNFLVPVGGGFMFWVLTIGTLPWKWSFLLPYSYTTFNFLKHETVTRAIRPPVDIHLLALGYFVLFTIVGYVLFVRRRM
jgi:hypothetical protein